MKIFCVSELNFFHFLQSLILFVCERFCFQHFVFTSSDFELCGLLYLFRPGLQTGSRTLAEQTKVKLLQTLVQDVIPTYSKSYCLVSLQGCLLALRNEETMKPKG